MEGTDRPQVHPSGDVFDRFAYRIEDHLSEAWVSWGTLEDRALLREVCPRGSRPLYIAHGSDAETGPRTLLRKHRDWWRDLCRLAEGTQGAGGWHVIVVGGLPADRRMRASIIGGIEDGLRRSGADDRFAKNSLQFIVGTETCRLEHARRHLTLIEIAFPGLVEVPTA